MADSTKATILIVDDEAANIQLLTEILRPHYTTLAVKSGTKALETAAKSTPDLILLDVMMPGLDGFTVCRKLKATPQVAGIPVIFVTALSDAVDEANGFACGGLDYIVKPVSPPVVLARVATHLKLKATETQLRTTLHKTLSGSVSLLTDLLSLSNPVAYNRANRLSSFVKLMAPYLDEENYWQFELAAMFSQVGCLTIPPEVLEKIYRGNGVSAEEQELYDQHPQTGSQYIARIPQLENVAAIIASMGDVDSLLMQGPQVQGHVVELGSRLLCMVLDYDRLLTLGVPSEEALQHLKQDGERYGRYALEVLEKGLQANRFMLPQKVSAFMLKTGCILRRDAISSTSGKLLLAAGTELSPPMIEALQRAASFGHLDHILDVLTPP